MTHLTYSLAVVAVLGMGASAAAQNTGAVPARVPRFELGAGVGMMAVPGEEGVISPALANIRAGVAIGRRWRIEGVFDLNASSGDALGGLYRLQARWTPSDGTGLRGFQPFLTGGGTGWLARRREPEHRWADANGDLHVIPSRMRTEFFAPIFPTVGVGVQKKLTSRVTVRTELATVVAVADDFVTAALQLKDRLWFVANYRKFMDEQLGSFVPATIRGKQYDNYNAPYDQQWLFAKLTAQLAPSLRWFGSYNYANGDRPQDFTVPARRALDATRHWQSREHTVSSQVTWVLSNRTLLDARFGLWRFNYDGTSQGGPSKAPRSSTNSAPISTDGGAPGGTAPISATTTVRRRSDTFRTLWGAHTNSRVGSIIKA